MVIEHFSPAFLQYLNICIRKYSDFNNRRINLDIILYIYILEVHLNTKKNK
jgi:hypothetical protein